MRTLIATLVLLTPCAAWAQAGHGCPQASGPDPTHHSHRTILEPDAAPQEAGQSAFAALGEIVTLLTRDPETQWSRVDIASLRDHLIDMDALIGDTRTVQRPIEGGLEIEVQGSERGIEAARRMMPRHAAAMADEQGWSITVVATDPLTLRWTTDRAAEVAAIRALGFYGLMASGDHHPRHHLAIALGRGHHSPAHGD